jgi:hypothetical protein
MRTSYLCTAALLALAGIFHLPAVSATAQESTARKLEQNGLKLEIAPLLPDQVRAFFLGRGFSATDADHIVTTGCVFRSAIGSAFRNTGEPAVSVSLSRWRVRQTSGEAHPPVTRDKWAVHWKKRAIGEDAATAFHWALFPAEQTFAPTDYNWGLLTFGLPPATRFTLELYWRTGERDYNARLENLQCGQ